MVLQLYLTKCSTIEGLLKYDCSITIIDAECSMLVVYLKLYFKVIFYGKGAVGIFLL